MNAKMAQKYDSYYNEYHKKAQLQENIRYKKKYKKLKRIVKNTVFENAALCDQVAQMQENLVGVKEERLFLLRKLCQQQGECEPSAIAKAQANNISLPAPVVESTTIKKTAKKRNSVDAVGGGETNAKCKPKRCAKANKRLVQLIPLDIHGRPIFPIALGDLTVYSLGDVVADRICYHTEDVIYPVGFCSTRIYANLKDPRTKSLYTCKILDGGAKPRFEIVSDSDLDRPLVGHSPDECHALLLATISPILCGVPPKGSHFFGISHPTVQNLIQSSPGTRKLAMYKTQRFEVSKNQSSDRGASPMPEEEMDPGISFSALHRSFPHTSNYGIKQEPMEHDLQALQDLLV